MYWSVINRRRREKQRSKRGALDTTTGGDDSTAYRRSAVAKICEEGRLFAACAEEGRERARRR